MEIVWLPFIAWFVIVGLVNVYMAGHHTGYIKGEVETEIALKRISWPHKWVPEINSKPKRSPKAQA